MDNLKEKPYVMVDGCEDNSTEELAVVFYPTVAGYLVVINTVHCTQIDVSGSNIVLYRDRGTFATVFLLELMSYSKILAGDTTGKRHIVSLVRGEVYTPDLSRGYALAVEAPPF